MYQTPGPAGEYPAELTFSDAEAAIEAANERLKDRGLDTTTFLLAWDDGVITFEEGSF